MSVPPDANETVLPVTDATGRTRRPWWQRLGGRGLTISVLIHAALVAVALIWVVSTVTERAKPKSADTFSTGAGGGNGGDKAKQYKAKLPPKAIKSLTKSNARITSKNANAALAVASIPVASATSLAAASAMGGNSKGFGGGSGGGLGAGTGIGRGGAKNFVSLFGMKMTGDKISGLIGTFYDLKQTSSGKPTECAPAKTGIAPYRNIVKAYIDSGWSLSKFSRFFRSPDYLIGGQLWIPSMSADEAPRAYEVEKLVKPSRWVIHYKANVEVPQDTPFRFVGSADDWMVVRFAGKTVLDDGYERMDIDKIGDYRQMNQTVTDTYKIDRKPGSLNRVVAGPWIKITKGTKVPMEVIVGETPGGVFDVYLAIEVAKSETKEKGQYVGEGKLKLFRCNSDPLPKEVLQGKRGLNIDMTANGWIFKASRAEGQVLTPAKR